jgi:benzoyl-CoA reductase/2-hydroxyglutaryl-CoA dehydratase subunit BcrC/BadD/HgdB
MSDLKALVDAVLGEPLAGARAHHASGGRVIGMVGADTPVEIVLASGAMPLQLPVLADQPTPLADRYLEPGFSPAARSIAQQWLSGAFDFLQAVVFSRSDDSAQRLYYYLCELQRSGRTAGPRPMFYDVAKIPRQTSRRHTEDSTVRLANELGCDFSALPDAIERRNRRRRLLEALTLLRESQAAPSGPEVERLSRAMDLAFGLEFDTAFAAWLERPRGVHPSPRLILAGSVPPDERLHSAVEAAQGRIVDEVGDHSLARFGAPIAGAATADAIQFRQTAMRSIADHYHALPCGSRGFEDRPGRLLARATACRAHGVILWLVEEDETLVWDAPGMQQRLSAAGIPVLTLTRRRWDLRDDALQLIGEFTARLRQTP